MNKKAAADFLGISPRALEYHVKQKHIGVRYVKGSTGDIADFDEPELRRLKVDIDGRRAPRASVVREGNKSPEAETRSLVRLSPLESLGALENILRAVRSPDAQPRADVGSKLMLTLDDAAALSSLSKNYLREAIKAGKLKAKIIGRGYKVKRTDLDAFIKKL
jgi:excisionase family DNA binding protein